jgi:hypothetical protein
MVFKWTSAEIMAENKFYSPLKIGLLTVALAYFLFTFHAMFTLSWIGEWEHLTGAVSFWIFITDVSGCFGIAFRFIASIIAIAAIVFYFTKKDLSSPTTFKVLRWILVLEAIYWLGLLVSGVWGVLPAELGGFGSGGTGLHFNISLLITTGIPCLVGAIAIPIALFKLASKLNVNKLTEDAIKWGLIAGTIYILVFWLNNTGLWIATLISKGTEYFSAYPENLLSFALTVYGLSSLLAFAAYYTGKSRSAGTSFEKLDLRTLGVIIVALGLYFLWNYLTWIFFGGWNDWYAWFLGHNLNLWLLSLPLVGLPLLFKRQAS